MAKVTHTVGSSGILSVALAALTIACAWMELRIWVELWRGDDAP